jgi:hypothetical protein
MLLYNSEEGLVIQYCGFGTKMSVSSGVETKSKKVCRSEGWEEEVDGVKQACCCGEECKDGNHKDLCVEVKVELPVLGKRKVAEVEEDRESDEEEEELEGGLEHGWYGPVRCEE